MTEARGLSIVPPDLAPSCAGWRENLRMGFPSGSFDHRRMPSQGSSVAASDPIQDRRHVLFRAIPPDEVAAVEHHGARSGQPPVLVAQSPQTRPISIPINPADDPSYFVTDAALT